MTEKEERNFEQKMFDIISKQRASAAAINCMEIAKDYALCKQVEKLNIDDVSNCCNCTDSLDKGYARCTDCYRLLR